MFCSSVFSRETLLRRGRSRTEPSQVESSQVESSRAEPSRVSVSIEEEEEESVALSTAATPTRNLGPLMSLVFSTEGNLQMLVPIRTKRGILIPGHHPPSLSLLPASIRSHRVACLPQCATCCDSVCATLTLLARNRDLRLFMQNFVFNILVSFTFSVHVTFTTSVK